MTNSSTTPPQRSAAGVSLRKTNKPLMEKRRRARINDSLSQLKSLVIQSSKKDSSQFNKLEKADILELTVKHLRNLQGREQQQLVEVSNPDSAGKYCAGFIECANEVIRFLKQSQGFSDDVKTRVVGHLASCLQFTNQPYLKTSSPQQQLPTAATTTPAPALSTANGQVLGSTQPTTAAQLANGQIIHIVNAPFQTASKPAQVDDQFNTAPSSSPATSLQISKSSPAPLEPSPVSQKQYLPRQQQHQQQSPISLLSVVSPNVPAPAPNTSSSLKSCPSTLAAQENKSYMKFSQPLHIQIPTTVSPFVIKGDSHHSQSLRRMEADSNNNTINTNNKRLPQQTAVISPVDRSRSNISPISPAPLPSEFPTQSSKPSHKHVHFYPNDLHLHNDYLPRHRTYSMTSSSSESEMSPLNLSQSPVSTSSSTSSYDQQKDITYVERASSASMEYLPVGYKLDKVSPNCYTSSQYHHHHHPRELKENLDMSHPNSSNFTSVIVNAKRSALDVAPNGKFVPMELEDERLCLRQHGTPSPASSMGEERLWRPW